MEPEDNALEVFISYSWDSDEHKEWVLKLADRLTENGIYVYLDQYDLRAGKNMDHFIETAIKNSVKVLIILTPNYAIKADGRKGGVGREYSIITSEIEEDLTTQTVKYIPILREGDKQSSCPTFLKQLIYFEMKDDSNFDSLFEDLLREIFDNPKIKRPPLGAIPNEFIKEQDNEV